MATASPIPPARPGVLLELDADEAELVLALLEQAEPEDRAAADRRMNVAGALIEAGVRRVELPLVEAVVGGRRITCDDLAALKAPSEPDDSEAVEAPSEPDDSEAVEAPELPTKEVTDLEPRY